MADPHDHDPNELLDSLVFAGPDEPLPPGMTVPPRMQPGDQILVHRSVELDLPTDVDKQLRAAAAAHGMSVEAYISHVLVDQAAA
jgi:hypothetical protein